MAGEKDSGQLDDQLRRRLEQEAAEGGSEARLREQDPYWGLNRNLTRMVVALRDINNPKTPEERKKELRESLPVLHERFMIHFLADGKKELDDGFLQFENLYPFKTSPGDGALDGTMGAIGTTLLEEDWARTPESQFWLTKTAQDTLWVAHNRKLQIGMSGMVNKMYDWEKIMMQVMETYRKDPMSLSYELTFKKKFRAEALPDTLDGKQLSPRERFSLRERGVKYHSDNEFWKRAAVGTSQAEFVGSERRSMGAFDKKGKWIEGLNETEFKFTQLMFGMDIDGNWTNYTEDQWAKYKDGKFPNQILSWQSMNSSQANKEIYIALIGELLTRNVKHELEKPEYRSDDNLKLLVEEIKKSVNIKRSKLFSQYVPSDNFGQDKYLDNLLAEHVVKSSIVFDWGHKVAIHDDWQWNYNSKGEREYTSGPVGTATDAATGPRWRMYHMGSTLEKNWPSGILPDADLEYWKKLKKERPDFKPGLKDLSSKAAITKEELEAGELLTAAFQTLKRRITEANPDAWNLYFAKMIWYWETSYKTDKGYNLVLPMWTPPVFESLDFLDTIPWDPREKIKLEVKEENGQKVLKGGLTVHEALQMGYNLSDKEWSEAEGARTIDSAYYRHLITLGQLQKILHVMTAKPELASQELSTLLGVSAMFNEWEKRDELGPRDEKSPVSIINAPLAPLMIMETTGRIKRGIFTIEGSSPKRLGEWVAGDVEEWRRTIERSVPYERDGIKGYKDIMLAFYDFYFTNYVFAANRAGISVIGQETSTIDYLIKLASQFAGVTIEKLNPSILPEATMGR